MNRFNLMKVIIIAIFCILIIRLGYLQIVEGQHYMALANNNRLRSLPIPAARGTFYDRTGLPLVANRPSFSIFIQNSSEKISDSLIKILSHVLEMNQETIRTKIQNFHGLPYEPIPVKTDVSPHVIAGIEENRSDFSELTIMVQPERKYIYQESAAHVFGYVGEISKAELESNSENRYKAGDIVGKLGLERMFDQYVRGHPGAEQIEVDADGQTIAVLDEKAPIPGNDLVLTLDYALQAATENAVQQRLHYLQTTLGRAKAQAAAAVVMNPNTGEILAMASWPSFNPNLFNGGISSESWEKIINNPYDPMENRAISGEYPPGSIFKIITGTAALELGKVLPEEKILDTGKHWLIPKGNAGGEALGWIDFKEALAKSDNVYFYEMGNRLGIDNLEKYARLFGLGRVTGIDLPGEESGLVANRNYKRKVYKDEWYLSETFDAAIGQGFQLVTPLQLALVMGEVANGGFRYQPYLVSKVVSPDGKTIKEFSPTQTGKAAISETTLSNIRTALHEVALPGGTAAQVFSGFPVSIAGKTGTAETGQGDDHGWFVAYAPFEKPEIVVSVLVEHGGYGVQSAAPIVKDILTAYFHLNQPSVSRQEKRHFNET